MPNGANLRLGHRRLSILDLSEAGHQPMSSPRSGAVIVYNGEVYNFRELRKELQAAGYAFQSDCDTEVVLAAYDEWGADAVSRLRGMFAIGVFDPRNQRVVLARDRLGIKPLYFYEDEESFGFCSELTAFAALPDAALDVSHEAMGCFLRHGYIPGPLSILKRVRKLGPGHLLTFDCDRRVATETAYWDVMDYYQSLDSYGSSSEAVDAIEADLMDSVRCRLISDVPLGAFLSGGIDSSLVVAMMRRVHNGPIRTFTIGFEVPQWDEAPAARRIADHFETEHEEYYVSEDNVLDAARDAASYYDEPFADPSNIPTLLLARLTRRFVTVALSGDGGDEFFWGYEHYRTRAIRWFEFLQRVPRGGRNGLGALLRRFPNAEARRIGHLLNFDGFGTYYMRPRAWLPGQYEDLYRSDGSGDPQREIGRRLESRFSGFDKIKLMSAMDVASYLPEDILTKVDRATMSVSLEARVPLLDHVLVQRAAAIPSRLHSANGESKHLLKTLLGRYLPRALWDRPKKGFGLPLSLWLRTTLRSWTYDSLRDRQSRLHDWLNRSTLERILDDHATGRRDAAELIWACLQLAGWDRRIRRIASTRYEDSESVRAAQPMSEIVKGSCRE